VRKVNENAKVSVVKRPWFWLLILAALALVAATGCFYTVREGEIGVVRRFTKVVSTTVETGLHIKAPFVDSVDKLPAWQQVYDMNSSDVLTSDKKAMIVDNYVLWRIVDPRTFIQTVGQVSYMQGRIDAEVYNAIKNIMGTMAQSSIIGEKLSGESSRSNLNDMITKQVNEKLAAYGVEIIGVEIKKFDLPDKNEQAVYLRMISERDQNAAEFRAEGELEATKLRNDADKEIVVTIAEAKARAEELRGQGESEYMRILSEAYSGADRASFYEFLRTLEAAKKAFSGGNNTIILPADSILGKALTE